MKLDNEWIWILIQQAENISLADDLFYSIHVSIGKLFCCDRTVFLCIHHDFALVYYLHSKKPSICLVSNQQDFCKCSLPQNLQKFVVRNRLLSHWHLLLGLDLSQVYSFNKRNFELENKIFSGYASWSCLWLIPIDHRANIKTHRMSHMRWVEELSASTASRNWLTSTIGIDLRIEEVSQLVVALRQHKINTFRTAIICGKTLSLQCISIDVRFRLVWIHQCSLCLLEQILWGQLSNEHWLMNAVLCDNLFHFTLPWRTESQMVSFVLWRQICINWELHAIELSVIYWKIQLKDLPLRLWTRDIEVFWLFWRQGMTPGIWLIILNIWGITVK